MVGLFANNASPSLQKGQFTVKSMSDTQTVYLNSQASSCGFFDQTIVNTTNKMVGSHYFSRSAFEDSLPLWNSIPLIMTANNEHPNPLAQDPKAELARMGGIVVGRATRPRLESDRFMMDLKICNQFALEQQRLGRLSLSSAFTGVVNTKTKVLNRIERPDHILLFPTSSGKPKDSTVLINKIGDINMSNKFEYLHDGQIKSLTNSTKAQHEKWLNIIKDKYGAAKLS